MAPTTRHRWRGAGSPHGARVDDVAVALSPCKPIGTVVFVSLDEVRAAYIALGERNSEPLVSLMRTDMEWRGRRSGWRFWRPVPS